MAFHFPLMPRMYMAIAQEDRHPLVEIMQQTPEIPDICQWAIFCATRRADPQMVTSRERDYSYRMYAADRQARINLGIRRRLAAADGERPGAHQADEQPADLSMPGSPILSTTATSWHGDNIYLGDRNGVRTPMQWSPDRMPASRARPAAPIPAPS